MIGYCKKGTCGVCDRQRSDSRASFVAFASTMLTGAALAGLVWMMLP